VSSGIGVPQSPTVTVVDIIIMALLLTTVLLVVRGAERKWILTTWIIALVLMLGLFRYHVTSPLDLSF
jgi:hypothetical protein